LGKLEVISQISLDDSMEPAAGHTVSPSLSVQLEYWKQRLKGIEPLLLPNDRPRTAMQRQDGTTMHFTLPLALTEALKELSRKQGATLYMILLAAFQALLGRYSGQSDIAVGSPIAGRSLTQTETTALTGLSINTLVLRTDLSGHPDSIDLLQRVKETTLEAYANQDVPFDKLVELLLPQRDQSRSPLFQVLFVLQNASGKALELGAAKKVPNEDSGTAQFEISLALAETLAGIDGFVEYNTDLFEAATITRMVGHYSHLLSGMTSTPHVPVDRLDILSAEERQALLEPFNQPKANIPSDILTVRFETQARETPAATAVVFGEQSVTYAELNEHANRMAHFLLESGVGVGSIVGLALDRSIEMVVAIVATLKAGAGYLPLDPDYPQARLAYMMADAAPAVVLTTTVLHDRLSKGEKVVCLDAADIALAIQGADKHNPASALLPQHPAYVIYTSGSTGTPKGVVVTHENITRLFAATEDWFHFGRRDVWSLFHSYAFDFSVWELWGALLYGGRLVVVSKVVTRSPSEFLKLLAEQGVTVLNQTPSAFYQLMQADKEMAEVSRSLALRTVIFGGEALDLRRLREWYERHPEDAPLLVNMYGITETTVHVSYLPLTAGLARNAGGSLIGGNIPDLRIYVLDEHLQLVPVGVAGEMYVAGAGLAQGYLNRPELTAERFIPHPFGPPGARLYRTGDVARWQSDHALEYLGRADQQVKIRGFRIELGEIETVLLGHPGVREAVVLAREDQPGEKRLVAYIVPPKSAAVPGARELREYLSNKLPEYMVPSAYVRTEQLPLTTSGKLDRSALLALKEVHGELEAEYVGPRTATEELLAGIWAEVLGHDRVGMEDNFFELGGHSLLATQVISRLRQALAVEVQVRKLFTHPTIGELARVVDQTRNQGLAIPTSKIKLNHRGEDLPLSFAQQRLWYLDQLLPGNAAYNISVVLRTTGRLLEHLLGQALDQLVRRHEPLRTHFAIKDSRPVQQIPAAKDGLLVVEDLSAISAERQESEVQSRILEQARTVFDLGRGPLLRARLLHLGSGKHVLLLTVHHIASDGWSVGLLIRELTALYDSLCQGKPSPLPLLTVQYADYAVWQRECLQGEMLEEQLKYWRTQLANLPVLDLPTDRPRPATLSSGGANVPFRLSAKLTAKLRQMGRRQGVTMFMTQLAAFQLVLSRWSRQEDIAIGSPIANRNRTEIEGLIGFFVNTLVLRTDLSGNPTFQELLERVREISLQAYSYQDIPFERVVEELRAERGGNRSPLFQVMLAINDSARGVLQLSELTVETELIKNVAAKFDLALMLEDDQEQISGELEYSTDLFEAGTVRRMVQQLERVLDQVAEQPQRRIAEIDLLSDSERVRALVEWNRTERPYPVSDSVHGLFEAQAKRTPARVAVACDGRQFTYSELNQRANQLARYLKSLGASPDVRIAVCLERGIEMVVGILGVLKAGAAYVPLDPAYPAERLEFMAADSQATLLLSQEKLKKRLAYTGKIVALDQEWDSIAKQKPGNLGLKLMPKNLAYMIYTSGSTGRPKGTTIEHRSAAALIRWASEIFDNNDLAGVLASTSICFDLSVFELFVPLSWGGKVILVENALQLPYLKLAEGVTLINTVPSIMAELLRLEAVPAGVKTINLAGEALKRSMVEEIYKKTAVQRVFNLYGPTEDTTYSTYALLARADHGLVPIGRPIANTQVYLLDKNFCPVPVGVAGELYIGGAGLARSYWNRAELTAERFSPNPFSTLPGERLYRTGDLACYGEDGRIEYLGRMDQQVKLRGHRIELEEIEAALAKHELVREAIVLLGEDHTRGKQLVAYVSPFPSHPVPDSSELRSYLQKTLPEYMVPAAFVPLDKLPLTPNGKIDRKVLKQREVAFSSTIEYVAPRTPAEEVLAKCWREVLKVPKVGVRDSFFALGGHSLLAIELVYKMNVASFQCSIRDLQEHPTIERLIEHGRTTGAGEQASPASLQSSYPLLPVQLRAMADGPPNLNGFCKPIPIFMDIAENINESTLIQALELWYKLDIFRLRFRKEKSEWRQFYEDRAEYDYCPIQEFNLDPTADEEALVAQVVKIAFTLLHNLNIFAGPNLQVALLRENGKLKHMIWLTDHLFIDNGSFVILYTYLTIAYKQIQARNRPSFPKDIVICQWAEHLAQSAKTEPMLSELDFWKHHFNPAYRTALITQAPEIPRLETEPARTVVMVGPTETRKIFDFIARHGSSFEELCLGNFLWACKTSLGRDEQLIVLVGNGREKKVEGTDLSRGLGWFSVEYPGLFNLRSSNGQVEFLADMLKQQRQYADKKENYGALRYLNRETEKQLADAEDWIPGVAFNCLGTVTNMSERGDQILMLTPAWLKVASEFGRVGRDTLKIHDHTLDWDRGPHRRIAFALADGGIQIALSFYKEKVDPEDMRILAEAAKQAFMDLAARTGKGRLVA